jgi:FtsP/CotA-like multicopper oxidase with cupredoxin domain
MRVYHPTSKHGACSAPTTVDNARARPDLGHSLTRPAMRSLPWLLLGFLSFAGSSSSSAPANPPIEFNDNLTPAGTVARGVLTVALEARLGDWHALGPDQPGVPIFVFGEPGKPLQDPGPLLRVSAGTEIRARITNRTTTTLVVHGLARRRVNLMDTLVVPAGETRETRFTADAPGTYYYWGTTTGKDFEDRMYEDAHLNGALIVDPAGAAPKPDRVFVVERWIPGLDSAGGPNDWFELFTINGRPWPYTERLTYGVGDSVRWRIINATNDVHPFHMHGFFYRVDAHGDLQQDTLYWPAQRRMEVTEPLWDGQTMDLAWSPDRPGGWIFHCHLNWHVVPNGYLPPDTERLAERIDHVENGYPGTHMEDHARFGMGGLVLGIYIRPPAGWKPYAGDRRTLRLLVQSDSAPGDSTRRFGYVLQQGDNVPPADSIDIPGPVIVLHRGEPTRIWVVNHTPEMTQVHWHGLEIESYYDGVAGVSGTKAALQPPLMPGDSFEVRVTPSRPGSYMYHTHINDIRQQSHGLYGALVVLDSGETWDPDTDRVFITGDGIDYAPELNGTRSPAPLTLRSGVPYRFRLMNITMGGPALRFVLAHDGAPVRWRPLAKDAYALPPWQTDPRPAQQQVSIGETYDFLVQAPKATEAALELRRGNGGLLVSQAIRFVK